MEKTKNNNSQAVNAWLVDEHFLKNTNFHDLYYLETLCYKIHSFLKNIPVHVYTSYDVIHHSIYFMVGQNKYFLPVDTDVSYGDFITLLKRWLLQFYIQCEIEREIEEEYSDTEILEIVEKQKISLNDALLLRKVKKVKEFCIIDKIYILKDSFVMKRYLDGTLYRKELYISGKDYKNIIPLSYFLDECRKINKTPELYDYIFNNSKLLQNIPLEGKRIDVFYSGKQMLNFFKINFADLFDKPLVQVDEFVFEWGKFTIHFESRILKQDCLELYYNMRSSLVAV